MLISLLTVAHIILAILLILVVLLQRSESSMGALGGANAVFTGKSVSGILTKATAIIATLFIVVSVALAHEIRVEYKTTSVVDTIELEKDTAKKVEDLEPMVPATK